METKTIAVAVSGDFKLETILKMCGDINCVEICIVNGEENEFASETEYAKLRKIFQNQFASVQNQVEDMFQSCGLSSNTVVIFDNVSASNIESVFSSVTHTQLKFNLWVIMSPDLSSKSAQYYFQNISRRMTPRMMTLLVDTSNEYLEITQIHGTGISNEFDFEVGILNNIAVNYI